MNEYVEMYGFWAIEVIDPNTNLEYISECFLKSYNENLPMLTLDVHNPIRVVEKEGKRLAFWLLLDIENFKKQVSPFVPKYTKPLFIVFDFLRFRDAPLMIDISLSFKLDQANHLKELIPLGFENTLLRFNQLIPSNIRFDPTSIAVKGWKYGFKYDESQEYDEKLDDLVPSTADLIEKDLETSDLTDVQRQEVQRLIDSNRKLKHQKNT